MDDNKYTRPGDVEKTFDELFPKKSYDVLEGNVGKEFFKRKLAERRLREALGLPDPTTVQTFAFSFLVVYLLKKYPLLTIGTILFFYLFWLFFTRLGQ